MALAALDRTAEFHSYAESAVQVRAAHEPLSGRPLAANGPRSRAQQRSEFSLGAAQVGRLIHETAQKLAQLSKLARTTSLFNDPALKIQELTFIIKQDIQTLKRQVDILKQKSDNTYQNKQSSTHSEQVVRSLQTQLADTTNEFQRVLTVRTENMKQQQAKRQRFTGAIGGAGTQTEFKPFGSTASQTSPGAPASSGGNGGGSMMQQQQQTTLLQDNYLESRVSAAQHIESTIVELQDIFATIGNLVAEQQDMVERIDTNTEASLNNIEQAEKSLLEHMESLKNNKWLVAKVFFVLIVFSLVFLLFFA